MGGLIVVVMGGVVLAALVREQPFVLIWGVAVQATCAVFLSVVLTISVVGLLTDESVPLSFYALTLLLLCLLFFCSMLVVMKQLLPGILEIRFPPGLDRLGAMLLGFATGTVGTSFLMFVVCVSPLAELPVAKKLAGQRPLFQTTGGPVRLACKLVGHASFQSEPHCGRLAMEQLLSLRQQAPQAKTSVLPDREQ